MSQVKKVCGKKCKGLILDKERGVYCQHIERKLPKLSKQSVKAYPSCKIDSYGLFTQALVSEKQLEQRLLEFGLSEFEVEMLLLRFIEKKPMSEIVEIQGWTSLSSANYYLKKSLKRLREGRFSV